MLCTHTLNHEQDEQSAKSTCHNPFKEFGDLLTSCFLNLVQKLQLDKSHGATVVQTQHKAAN